MLEQTDQALREEAHQDAQEGSRQHVAGPVDIEVEAGDSDDQCQHEGRDPKAAFRREKGSHGGKGDAGVAGGEGIVPRPGDQELDGVVEVAGPGAGDEGLQDAVADRKLQSRARASTSPVRRVFGISSRTRARAIQISPWSLRDERKGSTASKTAQRQLSWMPFRMPKKLFERAQRSLSSFSP